MHQQEATTSSSSSSRGNGGKRESDRSDGSASCKRTKQEMIRDRIKEESNRLYLAGDGTVFCRNMKSEPGEFPFVEYTSDADVAFAWNHLGVSGSPPPVRPIEEELAGMKTFCIPTRYVQHIHESCEVCKKGKVCKQYLAHLEYAAHQKMRHTQSLLSTSLTVPNMKHPDMMLMDQLRVDANAYQQLLCDRDARKAQRDEEKEANRLMVIARQEAAARAREKERLRMKNLQKKC